MKFIKTLLSLILFFISALVIAVAYGYVNFCYIVGLSLFLIIFLIPSVIYEISENKRIPYIILFFLWMLSFIAICVYINVQGIGGAAGSSIHSTMKAPLETTKLFLITSFPYFVYVTTFLSLCKLWKECIWGCIGYGILFGLFAII